MIAVLLLVFSVPASGQNIEEKEKLEPENISAASAILIEPVSGRVLYEFNSRQRRPMASTTKIMTALVAAQMCDPTEILTVQSDCVKIEGSSLYLEEDEQMTMVDLLYGLLLRSGNDAAAAIGKYIAGDVSHFVSLMNRKAWDLGMVDTNFVNPHGLDHDEHKSTAYDMALLGAAFMGTPLLRDICITDEYISRELTTGKVRLFINNNKLLARDPRAVGIKIGWTDEAGRCLVAAARVGDMELVAVVLDAPDLYTDVSKLFDYGFGNLSMQELIPKGRVLTVVPVSQGDVRRVALTTANSISYPIFPGESVSFFVHMKVPQRIQAPIKPGESIGMAWVTVDDYLMEVDLVATSTVEFKLGVWKRLVNWVRGRWNND